MDLLGERERGKAKEIQHRLSQEWVRESGKAQSARARLVQATSCRFGFVQQNSTKRLKV